jgi:hypothetical protein
MGENRNKCKVLIGKTEGKGPLGRSRLRWMVNIMMDFEDIGLGWWLRTGTGGELL